MAVDAQDCLRYDAATLDWTVNTWSPATMNNNYVVNGNNIEISVSDLANALINYPPQLPFSAAFYQGDQTTIDETLLFAVDLPTFGTTNTLTIEMNFGDSGVGLRDVAFSIFDVDGELGSFFRQEQYTINGFLGTTAVNPNLTVAGTQTVSGNTVLGVDVAPPYGAGSDTGTIRATFPSAVDRVVVEFEIATGAIINPGSRPGFGIHNIDFAYCAVAAPEPVPTIGQPARLTMLLLLLSIGVFFSHKKITAQLKND